MFEALGLVFGGLLRLAPEVFALLKARREEDHEYRMTQLQRQIDDDRAKHATDLIAAQASMAERVGDINALIEAVRAEGNRRPSGIKWLDGVNQSVRPILTYWWCLVLYSAYKFLLIYVAIIEKTPLRELAGTVVTEFDMGVIASIFSFWFVDRALRKMGQPA